MTPRKALTLSAVSALLGLGLCGYFPRFAGDWDGVLSMQIAGMVLLIASGFLLLFSALSLLAKGRDDG